MAQNVTVFKEIVEGKEGKKRQSFKEEVET